MTAHYPQAPYFILLRPGIGAIARYHLDKAETDPLLSQLRSQGCDGISLSLWLEENAGALGNGDMFLEWKDGNLIPQMEANLCNFLATVKRLGFNWVQLAPQYYGEHDYQHWTSWQQQYFDHIWIFTAHLLDICKAAGLPCLIDACPEVAKDCQYTRTLWTNITSWFYPNGEPCWDFTMSFTPGNEAMLASIFRGLAQGPMNPPVYIVPHLYTNESSSFLSLLQTTEQKLYEVGLSNRIRVLGETDVLSAADAHFGQDLVQVVQDTGILVERVCPWQVDPSTPMDVNFTIFPPTFSPGWASAGC